ncbi:ATP-dependent RNA helicase dhx29 [Chytridiales sp. JEL 0842]|nr:ATP-dependent RNA helicase dhx29 [Chytridiales sp. JEL 0842]
MPTLADYNNLASELSANPTSSSNGIQQSLSQAIVLKVDAEMSSLAFKKNTIEADPSIPKLTMDYAMEKSIEDLVLELEKSGEIDWYEDEDNATLPKLHAVYLSLLKLGFTTTDAEKAMQATGGGSLTNTLDWLCLHLPADELPTGFTDKLTASGGPIVAKLSAMNSSTGASKPTETTTAPSSKSDTPLSSTPSPSEQLTPKVEPTKKPAMDANMKSWILRSAMSDSDSDSDNDLLSTKPAKSLLPPIEHATLTVRASDLKSLAQSAKQRGDAVLQKLVSEDLRRCMGRVKELEKTRGFDKRKAEVELGKLLSSQPNHAEQLAAEMNINADALRTTHKKAERTSAEAEASDSDDGGGGGGGLGDLFAENSSDNAPSTANSSAMIIKTMEIPTSWTGKTPKKVLQEYCAKQARQSKVKFYKINDSSAGYRSGVQIEGVGSKSDVQVVEMSKEQRVDSLKMADEYVATLALRTLAPNLQLYKSLPPDFRDLWIHLDDESKNTANEAKETEQKRRLEFLLGLMMEREERLKSRGASGKGGTVSAEGLVNEEDGQSSLVEPVGRMGLSEENISEALRNEMISRRKKPAHVGLKKVRGSLPVSQMRKEILEVLRQHQVVIISGETGSGKSTQIPQFILEDAIENGLGGATNVICTQPRRISATSIASRVSEEMGDPRVGDSKAWVGYIVRLESKVGPNTRLTFATTGILLRRLESDPDLAGVSHVVVDEVHERSLDSDFLLILLRRLVVRRQGTLKVVLMSATAESEMFKGYFEQGMHAANVGGLGSVCPVLKVPGRTFPVQAYFIEDAVESTGYVIEAGSEYAVRNVVNIRSAGSAMVSGKGGKSYKVSMEWEEVKQTSGITNVSNAAEDEDFDDEDDDPDGIGGTIRGSYSKNTLSTLAQMDPKRIDMDLCEKLIRHVVNQAEENIEREMQEGGVGSVLVFLPGLAEIRKLYDRLTSEGVRDNRARNMLVLPLHSVLGNADQAKVFQPAPPGMRKVVLATNIAETGITIPDVVYVIDTCRVREVSYDERRNITKLSEVLVSDANCRQRRGRAGRVRPGICYHLVSKATFESLPKQRPPEILRLPLEELVLRALASVKGESGHLDVRKLLAEAPSPPPPKHVERAITVLQQIQALTPLCDSLTPLGFQLATLPVDARIGKMLLYACALRCLDPILTIASSLSLGKGPFQKKFEDVSSTKPAKKFKTVDSDLLAIATAYSQWRSAALDTKPVSAAGKAARDFIQKNALSMQNLIQIEEGRAQLLRVLRDGGLVEASAVCVDGSKRLAKPFLTEIPPLYSANNTPAVTLAVLAAGLYPSLLICDPPNSASVNKGVFLHPPGSEDVVRVHSQSVLSGDKLTPGWYTSHTISKSEGPGYTGAGPQRGRIVAWDLNRVGSVAVAFAGGGGIAEHATRTLSFEGGRWAIKCVPRTAALVAKFLPVAKAGIEARMGLLGKGKAQQKGKVSEEIMEKAVVILVSLFLADGKAISL